MKVDVCLRPGDFKIQNYPNNIAVVIDVLRATSSIITAFANGCASFLPVTTVEEARDCKRQHRQALLAGERQGRCIEGFDIGNSPFEYNKDRVADQQIIMTTTNGTKALQAASLAKKVYVGAFLNSAALCQVLAADNQDVVIVCAGSEGKFSFEDALCAGLIANRLSHFGMLSDTAMAAQAMYNGCKAEINTSVAASSHAQYLISIGFEKDVKYCLQLDQFHVVPVYSHGVIQLCVDSLT